MAKSDVLWRHLINDELFKESGLYDYFIEEAMKRGMTQGRQQGLSKAAITVLTSRFGALSEELTAALQTADAPTLLDILTHVTTESMEQIRARLGL